VLRVWIDQDLCTGDGLCTDHCPELFVLLEDGISYVRVDGEPQNDPGGSNSMAPIPDELLAATVAAAEDCPGECIFLEDVEVGAAEGEP
jgi:ferredoxin